MKLITSLSLLIYLILFITGCKREVLKKESEFFDDGCKINSLQLNSDLVYTFGYDNNKNSCRQLNYLFFDSEHSVPYLFSENNKVFTETTYGNPKSTQEHFTLKYDSKNNVSDDGFRFSKIMWHCD